MTSFASVYQFLWSDPPERTDAPMYRAVGRSREGDGQSPPSAAQPSRNDTIIPGVSHDELIARIRTHDEAAFEALVRARYEQLVHFARGLTQYADDAEDVVQDVFAWVWDQGERWQPRGSLTAYLFAAVRNAALNRRAHARVIDRHAERARRDVDDRAVTSNDAADSMEQRDRVAALRHAVDGLTERQRSAFRLRYEQQLTVAQVAEVLEISPKGAERLLTRVVQILRAALAHLR